MIMATLSVEKHSKSQSSAKGRAVTSRVHPVLPCREEHGLLSVRDLAKATSLHRKRVETVVGSGLLEAAVCTWSGPLFPRSCLERLRRIVRLRRDLGINLEGIAAVLDMRERIESLQREVEYLRRRLSLVE
jgi:MerR family transcriptional regulator/heat shock protein HspR